MTHMGQEIVSPVVAISKNIHCSCSLIILKAFRTSSGSQVLTIEFRCGEYVRRNVVANGKGQGSVQPRREVHRGGGGCRSGSCRYVLGRRRRRRRIWPLGRNLLGILFCVRTSHGSLSRKARTFMTLRPSSLPPTCSGLLAVRISSCPSSSSSISSSSSFHGCTNIH